MNEINRTTGLFILFDENRSRFSAYRTIDITNGLNSITTQYGNDMCKLKVL